MQLPFSIRHHSSSLLVKIPSPSFVPSSRLVTARRYCCDSLSLHPNRVPSANSVTISPSWTAVEATSRRIFTQIFVIRRSRRPTPTGHKKNWKRYIFCRVWDSFRSASTQMPLATRTTTRPRSSANTSWMPSNKRSTAGSGSVLTAMSMQRSSLCSFRSCKYRHALPEGYVYKSKAEREAEALLKEKERAVDKNLLKLENIELLVCPGTICDHE